MQRRGATVWLWLALSHLSLRVHAQFQATATSPQSLDDTIAASRVEASERDSVNAEVRDWMLQVPGVRTRQLGGATLGNTLSLRGSESTQVEVFLGSIPLLSGDGSGFDLSTIPRAMLSGIEVYRGATPFALGSGALGGAVRLIPRVALVQRAGANVFAGTFEDYGARTFVEVPGRWQFAVHAGAQYRRNRYPYLDDGRTSFDASDDRERIRDSGETTDVDASILASGPALDGQVRLFGMFFARRGALQGTPARESDVAIGRRRFVRGFLGASYTRGEGQNTFFELSLAYTHEQREFFDPLAQFGLIGGANQDGIHRGLVRAHVVLDAQQTLQHAVLAQVSLDEILPLTSGPSESARRASFVLGYEPSVSLDVLRGSHLEVRPSLRLESVGSARFATNRSPWGLTGKISAALRTPFGIRLRSALARGLRMPSMLELFGNRTSLLPADNLLPELGDNLDLGLGYVVDTRANGARIQASVDATGFVQDAQNLIRYRPNTAFQYVAENIGLSRSIGLEFAARASVAWSNLMLGVDCAITAMNALDLTRNKMLPLRSPLTGYARLSFANAPQDAWHGSVFVDVEHVDVTFLDPENLIRQPARTRVSLGIALTVQRTFRFAASLLDVGDARGFDVLGYPLPGRELRVEIGLVVL